MRTNMKRTEPAMHLTVMDASAEVPMAEPTRLLAAVRERDQAAFTQLVAGHDHELLRLAFVISGSRQAAEDAAQATWEQLWRKPPQLRAPEKLRSWLLSVCANEARQAARRRRRGDVLEATTASDILPATNLAAELVDLQIALGRLSMPDRELLALRFVAELASAEIADHLGLSPEGARTRIHRLLQRLRTELGHD
jgi:RNA polymerase sigma-70 factor (ECF subfamily)